MRFEDHAGVYFVNEEEFEERFPHDPNLDAYLPATCVPYTNCCFFSCFSSTVMSSAGRSILRLNILKSGQ